MASGSRIPPQQGLLLLLSHLRHLRLVNKWGFFPTLAQAETESSALLCQGALWEILAMARATYACLVHELVRERFLVQRGGNIPLLLWNFIVQMFMDAGCCILTRRMEVWNIQNEKVDRNRFLFRVWWKEKCNMNLRIVIAASMPIHWTYLLSTRTLGWPTNVLNTFYFN